MFLLDFKDKIVDFYRTYLSTSVSELFPEEGSWINIDIEDIATGAKIVVPARIDLVEKRTVAALCKAKVPDNYKVKSRVFFPVKTVHYSEEKRTYITTRETLATEIIIKRYAKKRIIFTLRNGVLEKISQRLYERIPYKSNYNVNITPLKLPEKDKRCIAYNRYMENFFNNIEIVDIAPGGIGVTAPVKVSKQIKEDLKINILINFGQRDEYIFKSRLSKKRTEEFEYKTYLKVAKRIEKEGEDGEENKYFIGFQFKDVNVHREVLIETLNSIRRSEAAESTAKNVRKGAGSVQGYESINELNETIKEKEFMDQVSILDRIWFIFDREEKEERFEEFKANYVPPKSLIDVSFDEDDNKKEAPPKRTFKPKS